MPKNFAVNTLKFEQSGQTQGYFVKKDVNGIANCEDPDQTAPLGGLIWVYDLYSDLFV